MYIKKIPHTDEEDQREELEKLVALADVQVAEALGKAIDRELGEAEAKALCEDLAAVIAEHHLVRSPHICRKVFLYLISVTEGWNSL